MRIVAFTGHILAHITDGQQHGKTEFLTSNQTAWSNQQFQLRYNQPPPPPGESGFPSLVLNKLVAEFNMTRSWFMPDGSLSMLLLSHSTPKLNDPVLGNGITFDFKSTLDIDQDIIQFKGHLVALHRMIQGLTSRTPSTVSSLLGMVRSTYRARSEAHNWRNIPGKYSGEELATRWAAQKTYAFMLQASVDPDKAWESCGCLTAFGPADYIRQVDSAL